MPQQFIAKWRKADLSERSAYQQHFLDLGGLPSQPKPAGADPKGELYAFEKSHPRGGPSGTPGLAGDPAARDKLLAILKSHRERIIKKLTTEPAAAPFVFGFANGCTLGVAAEAAACATVAQSGGGEAMPQKLQG